MVSKRKGLPDWGYYLLAVLITALSIPLYQHIYAHAPDERTQPTGTMIARSSFYAAVPQPSQPLAAGSAHTRLLPGELCEAGYVIRKQGNTYTQDMDAAGRPYRCANGYLIETF
jgi:hypothetical protein